MSNQDRTKSLHTIPSIIPIVLGVAIGCCIWFFIRPPTEVRWMNDAVYFTTNNVPDLEMNKTLPANSYTYFFKQVVTTNKVDPTHFRFGDKTVEIGAREDGVIVWRPSR